MTTQDPDARKRAIRQMTRARLEREAREVGIDHPQLMAMPDLRAAVYTRQTKAAERA